MGEKSKKHVYHRDTRQLVKRIMEILELHKKFNPERYGDLDVDRTKSYISSKAISVTINNGSFNDPYCKFPVEWLKLPDDEIMLEILFQRE